MIVLRLFKALLWRIAILSLLIVISGLSFFAYVVQSVNSSVKNKIFTSISALPYNDTAMVLGAQVYSHNDPSPILASRLVTAADALKAHKVKSILMSGDGRAEDYNEVITMRNYGVKIGIPTEVIQIDDRGLRTYDSCWRAKHVFNMSKITVITQRAHLVRAVYTCQELGLEVVGAQVPATGSSSSLSDSTYEQAALVLAWLDLHIFHPEP